MKNTSGYNLRRNAAGVCVIAVLSWFGLGLAASKVVQAETVTIAVAANFLSPLNALVEEFSTFHAINPKLVPGSSGGLYAQIVNRAPYDIFLSADQVRPQLLDENGFAVAGSRFTYATGRLALWAPSQSQAFDGAILNDLQFRHLAIANAKLAPYGAAARETLSALGLNERLSEKIVTGQSIGQAYQFVSTGNAEFGFVALSQLQDQQNKAQGKWWLVPASLHNPIRQDGLLLSRAADNQAAQSFLAFLRSEKALRIIRSFGYDTP